MKISKRALILVMAVIVVMVALSGCTRVNKVEADLVSDGEANAYLEQDQYIEIKRMYYQAIYEKIECRQPYVPSSVALCTKFCRRQNVDDRSVDDCKSAGAK